MDFNLTEEQQMIRDAAREFAEGEIEPVAIELEASHEFPQELTDKMAKMGFMGLVIPEKYGGSEVDYLSYLLVEREIARASISLSMTLGSQNSLTAVPLMAFGSEELQARYLPKLASGEMLGCFGLTEPGAGSDPAGMTTTAEKKGEVWVVNGAKIYITTGSPSTLCVTFARTGTRDDGRPELSAFLADRSVSGYKNGTDEDKMGVYASPTSELIFEDCEIPDTNILGKPGDGFKIAMMTLNSGRLSVATQALAIAEAAYARAKKYSLEREAFGKKIAGFQSIAFTLADNITALNAAELLIYKSAWLKEQYGLGDPRFISTAAQAKVFATEMAQKVTSDAIKVHGGYGYMREYRVEEFYRAARLMEILEGTSEIQRLTISRTELGQINSQERS